MLDADPPQQRSNPLDALVLARREPLEHAERRHNVRPRLAVDSFIYVRLTRACSRKLQTLPTKAL
jgi:hypothetical protein